MGKIENNQSLDLMYIDLLKKSLTHSIWLEQEKPESKLQNKLRKFAPSIFGHPKGNISDRINGRIWPEFAHTMIGVPRMENLQHCVQDVIKNNIEGDLIETGVWRGGAIIFMRGILKAYDIKDRSVWAADSFEGLPRPNVKKSPNDKGDKHHTYSELSVSLEAVKNNIQAFDLLDDQVKFLKGWFKDTLHNAPISKIAVCRLDGDMYESTMDALVPLYPKISIGGYLIIDDYGVVPGCRKAVDDYRKKNDIKTPIIPIDGWGAFWKKEH